MVNTEAVLASVDRALGQRGFVRRDSDDVLACWVRRTLLTNRAVVAIECPLQEDPAVFAREARRRCARAVGFRIPLFYGIGLQVITLGPRVRTPPTEVVDRIDNQWCVIQAVHVMDSANGTVASGATWGQVVSGSDQAFVSDALQRAAGSQGQPDHAVEVSSAPATPVSRVALPSWVRTAFVAAIVVAIAIQLVLAFR